MVLELKATDPCGFFFFKQSHCPLADCKGSHRRGTPSLWAASQIPAACKCWLLDTPGLLVLVRISDCFTGVLWHKALLSLISPIWHLSCWTESLYPIHRARSSVSGASWQPRWHRLLLTWLSLYHLAGVITWAPGTIHIWNLCQGRCSKDPSGLWLPLGHLWPPPLDNVPQGSLKNLFQIRQWVGSSSKEVNVFDGTRLGLLPDPLVFYIISQMIIFLSVW